jgi:hypothetical protein
MKATLTFLFLVGSLLLFAQSNLTVFNNDGKQFYVILNGIKQNAQPQTNVVVSGIKNGTYAMKLIFADGVTKDIDKNFWLETPSDITAKVFFKKGVGKVQLTAPVPATNTTTASGTIAYRPNDQAIYSDQQTVQTTQTTTTTTTSSSAPQVTNTQTGGNANIQINASQQGTTNSSNTQSVSTTQTTNSSSSSQTGNGGVNVSINVNDPVNGGGGINMNMNVTDPTMQHGTTGMNTGVNTQGGAGGVNMNVNVNGNMNSGVGTTVSSGSSSQTSSSSTTVTTTTSTVSSTGKPSGGTTTNNTTGSSTVKPGTCKTILGDDAAYVKRMKETTFDSDRVDAIQADFANQCLVASQAYKIIETLTYSADRLEMSKYLYLRIIDKDKGNVLLPLFTFDAEKDEFTEYMKTVK